jgi:hypothetical protein
MFLSVVISEVEGAMVEPTMVVASIKAVVDCMTFKTMA